MVGDYPDFVQPTTTISGRPVTENEVWPVGGDFVIGPGLTLILTYDMPNDGRLYALDQVNLSWDIRGIVGSSVEMTDDVVTLPVFWKTVINEDGESKLIYKPVILANWILSYPMSIRARIYNSNDRDRDATILMTFMRFL